MKIDSSVFNVRRLLTDQWQDTDHLVKFLRAYGFDVARPMVYQWFLRARVPSDWAFLLLALLETERGYPLSLIPYVKR